MTNNRSQTQWVEHLGCGKASTYRVLVPAVGAAVPGSALAGVGRRAAPWHRGHEGVWPTGAGAGREVGVSSCMEIGVGWRLLVQGY